MGHSLAQWFKLYELGFHTRESQQAVDAVAAWRDHLMSSTVQPLQNHEPYSPLAQQLHQLSLHQEQASLTPSQHRDIDSAQQFDVAEEGWNADQIEVEMMMVRRRMLFMMRMMITSPKVFKTPKP